MEGMLNVYPLSLAHAMYIMECLLNVHPLSLAHVNVYNGMSVKCLSIISGSCQCI